MVEPRVIYPSFADLEAAITNLERFDDHGGGGNNGGMEARVAKLEASVEHIQQDLAELKTDTRAIRDKVDNHFLILGGMIIAAVLGLAGLMAKGFGWL